ncbi:Detoxification-like protein [Thalictrum thalictroides]|uniref:Detoxification-like protein n=1 Tax=Thalictrum thalictroides TaxID=46969 RepID=A0A7J6W8P4_THATH|nr:Detoxification-like protein [Thalictrum thalictroides]
MKASLKFREEEKPPLLRVKVPLNILGFPFQSGVSACGDSKHLSLNLKTFFESGPCLKLVYKPNDYSNPFSLVLKTGIGPFGSPISAPLSITAEFNLLSRGNPSFFLRFNPQFGDFSIKKSSASNFILPKSSNHLLGVGGEKALQNGGGGGCGGGEKPSENEGFRLDNNGFLARVNGVGGSNAVSNMIDGVFNGVEMSAKTLLPIRNTAVLKFNWGVRFPEEFKSDVIDGLGFRNSKGWISSNKIPFLVMNKISIEHVAGDSLKTDDKKKRADVDKEAEESCFDVKRQLDVLHAENGLLRRAVDELRSEISIGSSAKSLGTSVGDYRKSERKPSAETGNLSDNETKKASSAM